MAKYISDLTLISKSALAAATSVLHGRDTARALGDRDVRMAATDFADRAPLITTIVSSATPTPNADTTDLLTITALAEAAAFQIPAGTPAQGQRLTVRIKDDGTARALTYDGIYRAYHKSLPTTTILGQVMYLFLMYNSTSGKWDLVDVVNQDGTVIFSGTVNDRDIDADGTKLDTVETSATADQTDTEIRDAVEAATDSNTFTDADHTKLDAIEALATADQTDAEIRAAVEAATDSNVFTDAESTKLAGIEAAADVTDAINVDAAGATMNADTDVSGASWFLDEDDMASNDPVKAPSQQSVKAYIDARDAGLDPKASCAVATVANISLTGEQTIDGILTSASRILVKDQSAGAENGIYVTAAGAWARSSDSDEDAEVTNGLYVHVVGGTIGGKKGYILTTLDPITVGTTALVFALFSDATAAPVDSVHGRTGAVVSASGDYDADEITETASNKIMLAAERTKLGAIEDSATADQSNAEIKAAVEAATDSNTFTDADHTKLDAIESLATADQTAAEIRTLVDAATDSQVFTDADHTKLDGIDTAAKDDQTAAEIRTLVDSATDSNVFTDGEQTKLAAPSSALVGIDDTQTLTAKRLTPRQISIASSASWTIAADDTNDAIMTALAVASTINAPSGTPVNSQVLLIRIKDDGTGRALTWNVIFRVIGVTLPVTTVSSKTMYIGCKYNSADSKWDVLAVGEEA